MQCTEGASSCGQGQQGFDSLAECSLKKKKVGSLVNEILSCNFLKLFSFASGHGFISHPLLFFSQLTEKSGDIFVVLVILSYPEPLLQLNTV